MEQWTKLKAYANKNGIKIIGDIPIYVAFDSSDAWANTELFEFDKNCNPKSVAGCPPDAFCATGQLWGNPLYNWKVHKEEGFNWWIKRVKRNFELYDILRIDHFRGFAGYYTIPYGDKTARNGRWLPGFGKQLFAKIKKEVPKAKIIAEDLGFYSDEVGELLAFTGYPGMKLLQFAFFDDDSDNLPRNFSSENCIVYTGSHDADCTYSWCKNLKGKTLKRFKKECPVKDGEKRTYALIRLALSSKANLAVIPMQDYLELPNEKARMNTPSTPEGNWVWRVKKGYDKQAVRQKILAVALDTKRAKK